MELKDWILLLAPIMVNGVLLFLFQQLLSRQFSRRQKFEETQHALFKQYINQLEKVLEHFDKEIEARINYKIAEENSDDTSECLKSVGNKRHQTNLAIIALNRYCNIYGQVIFRDKYSYKKMHEFIKTFVTNTGYYDAINRGKIKDDTFVEFNRTRRECEKLIFDLMDCALAYICGSEVKHLLRFDIEKYKSFMGNDK